MVSAYTRTVLVHLQLPSEEYPLLQKYTRRSRQRTPYLVLAALVFGALALIETQLDSGFIRFTGGDVLVVVVVYALLMSMTLWKSTTVALIALGVAYLVEVSQALDLVTRLGIEPNRFTDVVLGNTFTWSDIAAYTVGAALSWVVGVIIERGRGQPNE